MKLLKLAGTIPALALVGVLGVSADVQASTLVVDRGLPDSNLNNTAGGDRSNTWPWALTGGDFETGDTFSLPSTGNPSLPSWRVDKLTTWFIAGNASDDADPLENRFSDISLFLGSGSTSSTTIDKVASSSITGNDADAANVTLSKLTYSGGQDYQVRGGGLIQIWQVDLTDLGNFSAGDYAFSVAGLPDDMLFFNHASNAPSAGLQPTGQMIFMLGSVALALIPRSPWAGSSTAPASAGTSRATSTCRCMQPPVPLPAAAWLLLSAFGGLGLAARRRRKSG